MEIAAIMYLYAPIMLFCITWIKLWLAVPACIIMLLVIVLFVKREYKRKSIPLNYEWIVCATLVGCLIFGWCILSGLGGWCTQTGDWEKHHVLLRDLVTMSWPVRYEYSDIHGTLTYYIGSYLIPAAVGKIFGGNLNLAEITLMLYMFSGIFVSCHVIYGRLANPKGRYLLLIFVVFLCFSTFLTPLAGIYRVWDQEDVWDGVMWLSKTIRIQYSSNVTLLRWVAPQYVPTMVSMALLFKFRDNYKYWGIFCMPLILYSTFTFLGEAFLMLTLYCLDLLTDVKKREHWKEVFSVYNIGSIVVGILPLIYILSNVFQEKPDSAGMGFEWIDYSGKLMVFLLFELAWICWAVVLSKYETANMMLWASAINLSIYPLFKMGYWNDLCMRASIPALCALCFTIISSFIKRLRDDRYYVVIIGICLMLTGASSIRELFPLIGKVNFHEQNFRNSFQTSEDYYRSADFLRYQYIDMQSDFDFEKYILQE